MILFEGRAGPYSKSEIIVHILARAGLDHKSGIRYFYTSPRYGRMATILNNFSYGTYLSRGALGTDAWEMPTGEESRDIPDDMEQTPIGESTEFIPQPWRESEARTSWDFWAMRTTVLRYADDCLIAVGVGIASHILGRPYRIRRCRKFK